MNAHHLLDAHRRGRIALCPAHPEDAQVLAQARQQLQSLADLLPDLQKVDFGLLESPVIAEQAGAAIACFASGTVRMPFEDCYFEHVWHEADGSEVISAYVASHHVEGAQDLDLVVTEFRFIPLDRIPNLARPGRTARGWLWTGLIVGVTFLGAGALDVIPFVDYQGFEDRGDRELQSQAISMVSPVCLMSALLAMPSSTVRVRNAPTHANRVRVRTGKAPLFSHHIVTVTPRSYLDLAQAAPAATGDLLRSPPRIHLRRGHRRHLRSGKEVWVSPCTVGDKARGAVSHDYRFVTASGASEASLRAREAAA